MSQATLSSTVYRNSDLFSGYFLDERVDNVADGLERYTETKKRADELDEKIQRTDDLIDEIVYELYGLTDEEIEIVEDAVGE
jgi:type II restriction/modification system DNA methylase subunit YeeA